MKRPRVLSTRTDLWLAAIVPIGFLSTGLAAFWIGGSAWWAPILYIFGVVPVLDAVFPESENETDPDRLGSAARWALGAVPALHVIGMFALLFAVISRLHLHSALEVAGSAVSMATLMTVAIAASHELIHRSDRFRSVLGEMHFAALGYWQFTLAHLYNHHAHVATEKDNHAPPRGVTFYGYLADSYPKASDFTRRLAMERNERLGIRWYSFRSRLWLFAGPPAVALALSFAMGGVVGVLYYAFVAISALILVETVFYLQHYGRRRAPGESIRGVHSWDSYHRFSNYLTYMVQRHADHHVRVGRPYFLLKRQPDSPRLPLGYPLLIPIALLPPLFFALIDRRIADPHGQARTHDGRVGTAGSSVAEESG